MFIPPAEGSILNFVMNLTLRLLRGRVWVAGSYNGRGLHGAVALPQKESYDV